VRRGVNEPSLNKEKQDNDDWGKKRGNRGASPHRGRLNGNSNILGL
jgi:hypothetical protein